MPAPSIAALTFFQTADVTAHDVHLAMIFLGIIAAAVIAAAVGMVCTSIFAAKLLHSVDGVAKEVKLHTGPLLDKTTQMLHELSPKIHHLTDNAEQISYTLRARIDEVGATVSQLNQSVSEINQRSRTQVAHVDGIVTNALNAVEDISRTVQEGIRGPVRQVAGVLAGLRAGLEKLVEMSPFGKD